MPVFTENRALPEAAPLRRPRRPRSLPLRSSPASASGGGRTTLTGNSPLGGSVSHEDAPSWRGHPEGSSRAEALVPWRFLLSSAESKATVAFLSRRHPRSDRGSLHAARFRP